MKELMEAAMNYGTEFHKIGFLKDHKIEISLDDKHYIISVKKK